MQHNEALLCLRSAATTPLAGEDVSTGSSDEPSADSPTLLDSTPDLVSGCGAWTLVSHCSSVRISDIVGQVSDMHPASLKRSTRLSGSIIGTDKNRALGKLI